MNKNITPIQWILNNAEKLHLSVDAYRWDLPFKTQIVDCKASLVVNGTPQEGRGSANSEELALLKAFSEAIDRVIFFDSKKFPTTNGLAVHSSEEEAIRNARCELVERDSFFCHFLTQTPFYSSSLSLKELSFEEDIFKFLEDNQIHFKLAEMRSIQDCHSFIFMAHGLYSKKRLGLMFGMGSNIDPLEAAKSAVYEGLRHVIANLKSESLESLNENEFLSLRRWTPTEHMALSNDLSYAEKLVPFLFDCIATSKPFKCPIQLTDLSYEVLPMVGELQGSPFFAVKAISPKLQELYFGPTKQEYVNLLRLSEFKGTSWTWNMVNKTPHPLA